MIIGNDISYNFQKSTLCSCEDFSFRKGFFYLSSKNKDIFTFLSLDFSFLNEGEFSVDGIELKPKEFIGEKAKLIVVDVKNMGTISLVCFADENDGLAQQNYNKLLAELNSLKKIGSEKRSQEDKMSFLKLLLSLNSISYILIDLNDPTTAKHRSLWETTLLDFNGSCFFLMPDFQKTLEKRSPISQVRGLDNHAFFRIVMGATSFLSCFFASWFLSLKNNGFPLALCSLICAFVLLLTNIFTGVLSSRNVFKGKISQSDFQSFELWNATANVVGLICALLFSWLLSKRTSFFDQNLFSGGGLAFFTLYGSFLLFSQPIIGNIEFLKIFAKGRGEQN